MGVGLAPDAGEGVGAVPPLATRRGEATDGRLGRDPLLRTRGGGVGVVLAVGLGGVRAVLLHAAGAAEAGAARRGPRVRVVLVETGALPAPPPRLQGGVRRGAPRCPDVADRRVAPLALLAGLQRTPPHAALVLVEGEDSPPLPRALLLPPPLPPPLRLQTAAALRLGASLVPLAPPTAARVTVALPLVTPPRETGERRRGRGASTASPAVRLDDVGGTPRIPPAVELLRLGPLHAVVPAEDVATRSIPRLPDAARPPLRRLAVPLLGGAPTRVGSTLAAVEAAGRPADRGVPAGVREVPLVARVGVVGAAPLLAAGADPGLVDWGVRGRRLLPTEKDGRPSEVYRSLTLLETCFKWFW